MKKNNLKTFWLPIALVIFSACAIANNTLAEESVQLDQFHANNDISCVDCHGDATPRQPVSMLKCIECHDPGELAAATAELEPTNPHENRHFGTGMDCNLCHHQHQKSVNYCLPCHPTFILNVP